MKKGRKEEEKDAADIQTYINQFFFKVGMVVAGKVHF